MTADPKAAAIHRRRAEVHWAAVKRLRNLGLDEAAEEARRAAEDEDRVAFILETGKEPRR